ENKWVIEVSDGHKALLDRGQSRLVFYKRNMPIEADNAKTQSAYAALAEAAVQKLETEAAYDFEIPEGVYRNPSRYYAMQNHFPAVYGIGETGLPGNADERRKCQA